MSKFVPVKWLKNVKFYTVFENEPSGGNSGGDGSGAGSNNTGGSGDTRTYTQAEYEEALKVERTRLEQSHRKTIQQLEALKASNTTTATEREQLAKRIQELESEYLTKDELSKRAKEKSDKEFTEKVDNLSKEAQLWKTRFEKELKTTAVITAASQMKARRPELFMNILGDNVVTNEVIDDTGKPTGRFEVKIKHSQREKDGSVKELVLNPVDAFKLMHEDVDNYGFLFEGTKSEGLSGSNGKGESIDITKLTPDEYQKLRKAGKLF